MRIWFRYSSVSDIVEKAATLKVLAWSLALMSFCFSFSASQINHATLASGAIGAIDLGAIAKENEILSSDETIEELLVPDNGLFYTAYKVMRGDTLSEIASRHGITADSIITVNGIRNARTLSVGRYIKIPTINGILYEAKQGDTAASIAAAHNISDTRIREINGIGEGFVSTGKKLFLPDARLSSWDLREISGDLFSWPIRGYITSWYGWRNDPITGNRSFHSGVDIGAGKGTPIRAAMEGVVAAVGFSTMSGNYVIIRHHSGYRSLYAHLDSIKVKAGRSVDKSTVIGTVGNTGYSTGAHLHFTISRNGYTMNPMTVLN